MIYFAIFLTGTLAVEISQIKQINVSISLKNEEASDHNEDEDHVEEETQISDGSIETKGEESIKCGAKNEISYNDKNKILELS